MSGPISIAQGLAGSLAGRLPLLCEALRLVTERLAQEHPGGGPLASRRVEVQRYLDGDDAAGTGAWLAATRLYLGRPVPLSQITEPEARQLVGRLRRATGSRYDLRTGQIVALRAQTSDPKGDEL